MGRYSPPTKPKAKAVAALLERYPNAVDFDKRPDPTKSLLWIKDALQMIVSISQVDGKKRYTAEAKKKRFLGLDSTKVIESDFAGMFEEDELPQGQLPNAIDNAQVDAKTFTDVLGDIRAAIQTVLYDPAHVSGCTYVLCFDTPGYVLEAKSIIQARRREVRKSDGFGRFSTVRRENRILIKSIVIKNFEESGNDLTLSYDQLRVKQTAKAEDVYYVILDPLDSQSDNDGYDLIIKNDFILANRSQETVVIDLAVYGKDWATNPSCPLTEEMRALESPDSFLDLYKPLPKNWCRYLYSSKHRDKLIRFLVKNLFNTGSSKGILMNNARSRFIVSGHCLTVADCHELGLMVSEEQGRTLADTPIGLQFVTYPNQLQLHLFSFLTHRCGETDFAAFFLARQLRCTICVIDSTDSDFVLMGEIALFKERVRLDTANSSTATSTAEPSLYLDTEIFIHAVVSDPTGKEDEQQTQPPQQQPPPTEQETAPPSLEEGTDGDQLKTSYAIRQKRRRTTTQVHRWISLSRLYDAMSTDPAFLTSPKPGARVHYIVPEMIASLMAAGTDYTDSFYFVTPEKFLEAYVLLKKYIKDKEKRRFLVGLPESGGLTLSGAFFQRLLVMAYSLAFFRSKTYNPEEYVNMSTTTFAQKLYNKLASTKSEKARAEINKKAFPTDKDIHLSFLHLQYYLNVIATSVCTPELRQPPVGSFGYSIVQLCHQEDAAIKKHLTDKKLDRGEFHKRLLRAHLHHQTDVGIQNGMKQKLETFWELAASDSGNNSLPFDSDQMEILRTALCRRGTIQRLFHVYDDVD